MSKILMIGENEELKRRLETGRNLVSELHDPENGRLDARRIAEFYGMPLSDVAREREEQHN